eukprot:jgi/Botrbrau1/10850/Bobra.0025s0028.1
MITSVDCLELHTRGVALTAIRTQARHVVRVRPCKYLLTSTASQRTFWPSGLRSVTSSVVELRSGPLSNWQSLQLTTVLSRAVAQSESAATADVRRVGMADRVIFRQLFDTVSSTYTYLLADAETGEAILIDPVREHVDRDLTLIKELGLKLVYAINTHCHADHVTGTGLIKQKSPGVKSGISAAAKAKADVLYEPGDIIKAGAVELKVLATPGHTDGCLCYYTTAGGVGRVFTGDAVLIRGCGRTDFQGGDAGKLYDSVHGEVFTLPDDTLLYPAHDYKGFTSSSVGEEKRVNPRLTKPKEEFIEIMKNLNLPYPKQIDVALPLNIVCGIQEEVA